MKEILSQSAKTFESESSDMINKHNKRWSTKIGNVIIYIIHSYIYIKRTPLQNTSTHH